MMKALVIIFMGFLLSPLAVWADDFQLSSSAFDNNNSIKLNNYLLTLSSIKETTNNIVISQLGNIKKCQKNEWINVLKLI